MKLHILFLPLIIISCRHKCHDCITFVNNSNKDLYYYAGENYPDTNILNYNPIVTEYYLINKKTTGCINTRSCFENKFNSFPKLIYFIYDAEVLKTVPWDTVMKKYMILKRYEFSEKELNDNNWTITYP